MRRVRQNLARTHIERDISAPVFLLLAAVLLLTPLLLRVMAGHPMLPGQDSYASLAPQRFSLYVALIQPLGEHAILLSVLLGLVSSILFLVLAHQSFKFPTLAATLFIANPLFISLFTSLSPYTLAVPAALASFILVRQRQLQALLLLALTAATAPVLALVLILVAFLPRRDWRMIGVALLLALPAATLAHPDISLKVAAARSLFAEFGASTGLSLVIVFLGVLERIICWSERRTRALLAIYVLLILALPFSPSAAIGLGILSAVDAANFLGRLTTMRWRLKEAKGVTLLLAACLLLFLLLTRLLMIAGEQPTRPLMMTLAALPPDEGAVVTDERFAPLVEHFTTHPAISADCDEERCVDVSKLYATKRMGEAEALLRKHNISYILITGEMRKGGTWSRDEEGLLFLLKHSSRFVKLAGGEEELWRFESA